MTWNSFHRRGETLRAAEAAANERNDGVLPLDLPGVSENFRDELDLMAALALRWHTRLGGNIERALQAEPWDPETAIALAWATTAIEMPGVRRLIDVYADHPTDESMAEAFGKSERREAIRVARAAGLANDEGGEAVAAGRSVIRQARAQVEGLLVAKAAGASSSSAAVSTQRALVKRIKKVLVA